MWIWLIEDNAAIMGVEQSTCLMRFGTLDCDDYEKSMVVLLIRSATTITIINAHFKHN